MRADLHIHTTASDGRWRTERLVAELETRSIRLFAIADHDTIANLPSAEALAHERGLSFLRGVEVSTNIKGRLFHILGYGFDSDSPALTELLHENRVRAEEHNDITVHKLIAAGYPIDFDDYAAYEYDQERGGWKTLNFLIDLGFCTGVRDYFDNLIAELSIGIPSYPHPAEAISVVQQAKGTPILAHPGMSLRHIGVTEESLRPFLDFGISGLECYSQYHDESTTRFCLEWCERRDLLITGGSDYHGGFVGRELGAPIVDTADLRLGELRNKIAHSIRCT